MEDRTSFGYEQVTPDEKTRRVRGVFDSVAGKYDVMNDVMSRGHAPSVEAHRRRPGRAARRASARSISRVAPAISHDCSRSAWAARAWWCTPTSTTRCWRKGATS